MTIKDIEILSDIDRANVRFYEKEGFISPERLSNGYRNYSEKDLQTLLRIKLLRSLHIPLDEIRALQAAQTTLQEVLAKQSTLLEREKQDAAYAQELCRTIEASGVSFASLNAQKYLDELNQTAASRGTAYFKTPADTLPSVFHPWRRFFARMLDLSIYELLWTAFLAVLLHVNLLTRPSWAPFLDSFVAIGLMLFIEPLFLRLFGTTPGKAVFGLHLLSDEERNFRYDEGLMRTWYVIAYGFAYNIPLWQPYRLFRSYLRCQDKELQPWDEYTAYTLKDTKWYRPVLYIIISLSLFTGLVGIRMLQLPPPNRGELTIAEFAENYNYYASFYNIDYGYYLNENGEWTEKYSDNIVYIDPFSIGLPEYQFATQNGYVTGLAFEVEIAGTAYILPGYDEDIMLSTLALAGAEPNSAWFSRKLPALISKMASFGSFEDFNFSMYGLSFTRTVCYHGYLDHGYYQLLFDDEKTADEDKYLCYAFSISKQP